jgi:hypothetical protein
VSLRHGPAALAAALAWAAASRAGEIPDALVVLEASIDLPGREAAAVPPRFVLLRDGQDFAGGSDRLYAGKLDKRELQALDKRAQKVRKLSGLGTYVQFGAEPKGSYRLRLLKDKDKPVEIRIAGSPAAALAQMQPLASFVADLASFHHPSLRPFAPAAFALRVREGALVGGCRPWAFTVALEDALAAPRAVSAAEASGWPTGALPASVCAGDRRYVVTLRPLLPGEQP